MNQLKTLLSTLAGFSLPVEYWDVRIEDTFETMITAIDGEISTCAVNPSLGAFIRVRKEGFWLYQSTTDLSQIKSVLTTLSSQRVRTTKRVGVFKAEKQPAQSAINSADVKFSAVPLEEKIQLLKSYDTTLAKAGSLVSRRLRYKDIYKVKSYLNSVGTHFEFDFNQGGMTLMFTLKDGTNIFEDHTRNYGATFADLKGLEKHIESYVKEAATFLNAPSIVPGKYKVILDPEVAGVFTHESFGHKSEADFMIGNTEALSEWRLGKKIGADCLTIVDHGLEMKSSGYVPIDDDGTPAKKNYLIRNGILTGRLHTRDTAIELGEEPTGNSRAMSFEFEPMVRMTSTYIEPGTESISSIMARSEGAIYIEGYKHGSGLSTFTIAPSRGYRIGKNGAKEPVRLTVISGSVFDTLNNVEAVSSQFELFSNAIGGCGKMDQFPLPVADGGPYVVISEMQVS